MQKQKMRIALHSIVCLLCLLTCPMRSAAESVDDEIERLKAEMYHYYSTDSIEQFMTATDRLKVLTLETGDERLFYKTWCNQAVFVFRKSSRDKGLAILEEVRRYATRHDSKFGLYTASSANSTMMNIQKQYKLAEKSLYECIDYLHRYFPGESAAVDYISLAMIYHNAQDYDRELECARKALEEPNVIPIHQQSAWAHICVGLAHKPLEGGGRQRFNEAYSKWQQVDSLAKRDSGLSEIVRYFHAKVNGHKPEMLLHARKIESRLNRYIYECEALAENGRYEEAYRLFQQYKAYYDSVTVADVRQQAAQHSLMLDVARAESEAKDLRIANETMGMWMMMAFSILTICFLTFYLYRRRQQVKRLREAYTQLEQTTTVKETIESELRIARDIQMGMVPSVFPAFPDRPDIDLYASINPAKEVGGDLYDFFMQEEKLYFCVGDVAGKGVPASMTMAVVVKLFRTIAKSGCAPEQIARKLNEALASDNDNGMFVTMFIGVVDLTTGRLDFCNAGHNPPVIIDMQHPSFIRMEANAPVGLWENVDFVGEHINNIRYKPLVVYTDGLNEAENSRQEQFGEARMIEVLQWHRFTGARQTVELLQDEVNHHVAGAEPSDDLTLLCINLK